MTRKKVAQEACIFCKTVHQGACPPDEGVGQIGGWTGSDEELLEAYNEDPSNAYIYEQAVLHGLISPEGDF